jgi:hypothetical protein
MVEALGSSRGCSTCSSPMQETGAQRLGSDVSPGSSSTQRSMLDELVCAGCGSKEWVETTAGSSEHSQRP